MQRTHMRNLHYTVSSRDTSHMSGEVLDDEDIQYVLHLRKRGEKVIGIDEQNRITVISNRR